MEGMNLEKVITRSGETVFKWQGRMTASSYDPRREAQEWLTSLALSMASESRLFVLGVGSGYHLVALRQAFPKRRIMAVDISTELIEGALGLHGSSLDGVDLVAIPTEAELLATERVRNYLRAPLQVVDHPASQQGSVMRYKEVRARVLNREPVLFADWLRREPRFARLFPLQAIAGGDDGQLLSIKDLCRFVDTRGNANREDVLIIKALRELVK